MRASVLVVISVNSRIHCYHRPIWSRIDPQSKYSTVACCESAGWAIAQGFILSYLSYQFIYLSETSEICFRARAMRIGNVGLSLPTMGEAGKDKNLATEIGKALVQLGGLPLLEAQNQVDVTDLRQRATDALRPEGRDADSHALCKKALCMNAWAPARHREQSCRPYLGKTPCPEEVFCHYAAIDVALADDEQRTRFGQHPCCGHCSCCMPKGQREAPLDLFPQCPHIAIE